MSDPSHGDDEIDFEFDSRELDFLQSRATYQSLVNTLPLSLLIKDTAGRRLFANRTYLQQRGMTLAELVGKRDEDLFPIDIARRYQADDEHVIRTGQSLHSVEQSIDSQGNPRWIERIKSPILDPRGKVIGTQLLFWDVTDRVSAEQELTHQRDLLNTLLKHIPDSIYFKDLESRFLRVSEALASKFGLPSAASAIGLTDADIFTEEHARAARDDELTIIKSRNPLVDRVEKETWPDHEDTWCMSTKMPFIDDHNQVVGTFGISRDITELIKSQNALREARDAADRANRAKSEFLANMSHEIRTPMNAIIGMSELLAQTQLSEEQADYVTLVRDSADSLLQLLGDILDFSKVEARKLELETIAFSIRDLVEKTSRALSLRAAERGLELTCHVAADIPQHLGGDPGRLRQVLVNLIGNAIKFTDEGEVVVEVTAGQRSDESPAAQSPTDQSVTAQSVTAQSVTDRVPVTFSVRDTGIGIPADKQAAVLEAFTQADTSTTRRFGGTGLGLAISKQLVELMDGQLQLHSRVGEGTTFFFTAHFTPAESLRSDPQPTPSAAADADSSHRPCRPLRVLVAEDGIANQHVAVGLLKSAGHHAVVASDGRETISRWHSEPFDVILMDMHMPVMDGIEATRQIRAEEQSSGRHIPIIALTAAAMKTDADACLQAGMDGYLTKPIHPRQLQQTLANLAPHPGDAGDRETPRATGESKRLTTGSGSGPRLAQRVAEVTVANEQTVDFHAAASRLPGGLKGVCRLAEVFQPECESLMQTLRDQIPGGDPALVHRTAHTLKGSANLFYAQRVQELAGQIEQHAQQQQLTPCVPLLQDLEQETQLLIRALENFRQVSCDI